MKKGGRYFVLRLYGECLYDRANKTLVQTTDLPDSTVDEQSVTVNGLLASSRSSSNLTTTYAYDALERQAAVTDPRTGATTIAYFATGTGVKDHFIWYS